MVNAGRVESFWKNAVGNPFYRPVKQQLTVRWTPMWWPWLRRVHATMTKRYG
jgi:hypothetical protein